MVIRSPLAAVAALTLAIGGCAAKPDSATPIVPAAEPLPSVGEVPLQRLGPGVDLVGMNADQLHAVLGQPSLRRSERAAHYWRYSFDGCDLDLYAYGGAAGDARVDFVRLRPKDVRNAAEAPEPLCSDLAARQHKPVTTGLPAIVAH